MRRRPTGCAARRNGVLAGCGRTSERGPEVCEVTGAGVRVNTLPERRAPGGETSRTFSPGAAAHVAAAVPSVTSPSFLRAAWRVGAAIAGGGRRRAPGRRVRGFAPAKRRPGARLGLWTPHSSGCPQVCPEPRGRWQPSENRAGGLASPRRDARRLPATPAAAARPGARPALSGPRHRAPGPARPSVPCPLASSRRGVPEPGAPGVGRGGAGGFRGSRSDGTVSAGGGGPTASLKGTRLAPLQPARRGFPRARRRRIAGSGRSRRGPGSPQTDVFPRPRRPLCPLPRDGEKRGSRTHRPRLPAPDGAPGRRAAGLLVLPDSCDATSAAPPAARADPAALPHGVPGVRRAGRSR